MTLNVVAVVGNPGHHTEMVLPVAERLVRRGAKVRVISLAEMRGFVSPRERFAAVGADCAALVPVHVRRRPQTAQTKNRTRRGSPLRFAVRALGWAVLGRRFSSLIPSDVDVAVIPNDYAFPYDRIIAAFHDFRTGVRRGRRVKTVLLQEGIRFPLPLYDEREGYGTGGADAVCAYGELAAEHFASLGVPRNTIHATGSPRFDGIAPAARKPGRRNAVAYLSNPIDDIGFCSPAEKNAIFARFLDDARPLIDDGVRVLVRLHPREERATFEEAIAARGLAGRVELPRGTLAELLDVVDAGVVLASTVGLEALLHGVPIGVLPIPGHGFVHDYVKEGAAAGLAWSTLAAQLSSLSRTDAVDAAAVRYLDRSLANRGRASDVVTDLVVATATRR